MKNKMIISLAGLLAASLGAAQAQSTIAAWDFDTLGTQAAPLYSSTPTTGSGFYTWCIHGGFADKSINAPIEAEGLNQSGTAFNNNSGVWRFKNVVVTGNVVPVPEPGPLTCFGLGLTVLIAIGKFRKH